MATDPAILALFGPAPDDVNVTESSVSENNGAVIAMVSLAFVAVFMRFVARTILRNPLKLDDWAIIAALLCAGATAGISISGGTVGSGKHVWALTVGDLVALYRLLYSYTFVYASSCTCIRLSILFFYQRIFSPLESSIRMAIGFAGFVTVSYPIIIWVTMATSCKPVQHFWTQFTGTTGQCININSFFLALGIINMLNDIILLALPFPRLMKLQMRVRKKVAICGILAVGLFVCIASIVRIHYLSVFMHTSDPTWLMGPVFIWSTIEPSVGIVTACLPHFAPLARLARQSLSTRGQSQTPTTAPSERAWPNLQYKSNRMNKGTQDDEIGLTNYVTTGSHDHKQSSVETVSQIHIQSTFVQGSSAKGHS